MSFLKRFTKWINGSITENINNGASQHIQNDPPHADMSIIPESEKSKYSPDEYYRYRPFAGTAFDNGQGVILFEERKKTAKASKRGLFPPEIILLAYAKSYPRNRYPAYLWFKYGVRDVGAMIKSLEDRGFIKMGEKEKYIQTGLGEKELKDNEFIVWAHKNYDPSLLGFDAWTVRDIIDSAPEKIAKYPWQDKMWSYMNSRRLKLANKNSGNYRNMTQTMAKFLEYEKKWANALKMYEELNKLDIKHNPDPQYPNGYPGIRKKIASLKKKIAAESNKTNKKTQ